MAVNSDGLHVGGWTFVDGQIKRDLNLLSYIDIV